MDTRTRHQLAAVKLEQIDRDYVAHQARFSGRPYLPTPRPTPLSAEQIAAAAR